MRPNRIEPKLSAAFAKDPRLEEWIGRLNETLQPFEESHYEDRPEVHPTLHVIGAPRSGTTLLTQLAAAHLDVGCINNLVASFWAAPCTGIHLSKRLLGPLNASSDYESRYGRTSAIQEPHEFGYFWSALLGYREMKAPTHEERRAIDWRRLRRVLTNMAHAYGRPVLFKPLMLFWHMREVFSEMPKSCFVWIRRDRLQNALSIYKARQDYGAGLDEWISIKPAEHDWLKSESVERQVAGQVVFVERAIEAEIARAAHHNILELRYEELCADPLQALERIQALLAANGHDGALRGQPPKEISVRSVEPRSEIGEAIQSALEQFAAIGR